MVGQLSDVDSTWISCYQVFPIGAIFLLLDNKNIKIQSKIYCDILGLDGISIVM
jgi:hypothetical protein